jgi:hypothetical protein
VTRWAASCGAWPTGWACRSDPCGRYCGTANPAVGLRSLSSIVTNGTNHVPATSSSAASPLTPGEALAKLFLDNADRGCNAENDALVVELLARARAVQELHRSPGRAH